MIPRRARTRTETAWRRAPERRRRPQRSSAAASASRSGAHALTARSVRHRRTYRQQRSTSRRRLLARCARAAFAFVVHGAAEGSWREPQVGQVVGCDVMNNPAAPPVLRDELRDWPGARRCTTARATARSPSTGAASRARRLRPRAFSAGATRRLEVVVLNRCTCFGKWQGAPTPRGCRAGATSTPRQHRQHGAMSRASRRHRRTSPSVRPRPREPAASV